MKNAILGLGGGVVAAIVLLYGAGTFLGMTHGNAVKRSRIHGARLQLQSIKQQLDTNGISLDAIQRFKVEPWSNTVAIDTTKVQTALMYMDDFDGNGVMVITCDDQVVFIYKDHSKAPRLVDNTYVPPVWPIGAY